MILRSHLCRPQLSFTRVVYMTSYSTAAINGRVNGHFTGVALHNLPKSKVFTSNLPPDPEFKEPIDSHKAPRSELGPRMVKGALYTYVRPEETTEPELLGVSERALNDVGLKESEQESNEFKDMVAGNKIFWDAETEEGIYPWAQCYGGIYVHPCRRLWC